MQHLSNPSVPKNHVKHHAQNILTITNTKIKCPMHLISYLSLVSCLCLQLHQDRWRWSGTHILFRCTYPFKTKSIFLHLHLLSFWKLITVHTLVGQCFVQFSLFFVQHVVQEAAGTNRNLWIFSKKVLDTSANSDTLLSTLILFFFMNINDFFYIVALSSNILIGFMTKTGINKV